MISVWEWVGIVLGTYGVIITIAGFIYQEGFIKNISWGAFMIFSSLIIYYAGRKGRINSGKGRQNEISSNNNDDSKEEKKGKEK